MQWRSFLKEYLYFSRNERYGLIILCGLIIVCTVIKIFIPQFFKYKVPDISAYQAEIDQFQSHINTASIVPTMIETDDTEIRVSYFYFNPNSATNQEWEQLGLNQRQINNIRNYQAKGGKFLKKEDFKKLYTMPASQYEALSPYMVLSDRTNNVEIEYKTVQTSESTFSRDNSVSKVLHIELNAADSIELMQLPGIGRVFASRIIKYRNILGGYVSVNQLGEVYGLSEDVIEKITPNLSVDTSLVQKIPINSIALRDMTKHPYIDAPKARGILKYRDLQGKISDTNELIRNNILTKEDATRLIPYFSFD